MTGLLLEGQCGATEVQHSGLHVELRGLQQGGP